MTAGTCSHTVNTLNSLLLGELTACEMYAIALDRIKNPDFRQWLAECYSNHGIRVHILRERIADLDAEPVESTGLWGAVTRFVEKCAALLGDKAAIYVLEEGEELNLRKYEEKLPELDDDSRHLVADKLLPAQGQTQIAMSCLKHRS